MDLAGRFAAMLLLVAIGYGGRRVGLLTARRTDLLGRVAFYVLLPALVFESTAGESIESLLSVGLVVGVLVVLAVLASLSWLVNRGGRDDVRSVAVVQSYHSNFGYFGLPVVAATLGSTAAGTASVILGIGALVQIPLTILLLVRLTGTTTDLSRQRRAITRNPVLLALAIGLGVATVGLDVPGPARTALGWLATLALPVALLAVGGSLNPNGQAISLGRTGVVVGLKVLVMPLVAWLVFSGLDVAPLTRNAAIVMFGAPTAVSTYVYAAELGGDDGFASVTIFVSTIASIGSLFVVLHLLS